MTDIPTHASTNQRVGLSYDRLRRRPIWESIRRVKGGSRSGRGWHADRAKEGSLLYNRRKREGKRKKERVCEAREESEIEGRVVANWMMLWDNDFFTTNTFGASGEERGISRRGSEGDPAAGEPHWTLGAVISLQTRHFITTALRRIISVQLFFSVLYFPAVARSGLGHGGVWPSSLSGFLTSLLIVSEPKARSLLHD